MDIMNTQPKILTPFDKIFSVFALFLQHLVEEELTRFNINYFYKLEKKFECLVETTDILISFIFL